jgi:tRNA A37 threonylcarbamoyladenosine dehydratase
MEALCPPERDRRDKPGDDECAQARGWIAAVTAYFAMPVARSIAQRIVATLERSA